MPKPEVKSLPPKITAGEKFVNRLSPATRERLTRIVGEPIAPAKPPDEISGPTEPTKARSYNRAQKSRIERRSARYRSNDPLKTLKRPRKNTDKDRRHLERLRAKLRADGHDLTGYRITAIPAHVWIMASDILADHTGRAAASYLKRCYHQPGARLIRLAAKGPQGSRPLSSPYARAIVALGLSIVAISKNTASTRLRSRLVKTIPETAFLTLLRNPYTGKRPALSTLTGRHSNGSIGYLDTLKDFGLLEAVQLPKSEVTPAERLGDYSTNRYYVLATRPKLGRLSGAEIDELLTFYPWPEIDEFAAFSRLGEIPPTDSPQAQALGP